MPRKLTVEDGKRYSLGARTTLALNQALKAAAKSNGRSVSQEIEFRLEASFAEDRMRVIAREEIEKAKAESDWRYIKLVADLTKPVQDALSKTAGKAA